MLRAFSELGLLALCESASFFKSEPEASVTKRAVAHSISRDCEVNAEHSRNNHRIDRNERMYSHVEIVIRTSQASITCPQSAGAQKQMYANVARKQCKTS